MTKEQAYERLELPVGTDLQTVRATFSTMFNQCQMQIDNAFSETSKRIAQQKQQELSEAYAALNESAGIDDNSSLPRTGKTYEDQGTSEPQAEAKGFSVDQALAVFGLGKDQDMDTIEKATQSHINDLVKQRNSISLPEARESYDKAIAKSESAKSVIADWLQQRKQQEERARRRDEEKTAGEGAAHAAHQGHTAAAPRPEESTVSEMGKRPSLPVYIILLLLVLGAAAFFLLRGNDEGMHTGNGQSVDLGRDSAAWESALVANSVVAYEHYLKQYPEGVFAHAATDSLIQVKGATSAKAVPATVKAKEPAGTFRGASSHTKALIQQGRSLLDKDQYKQAEAKLREALNAGDTDAVPYLAGALHGLKRYQEVVKMKDQYPDYQRNAVFQLHIARAYDMGLKRHQESIAWHEKSANQGNAWALSNLGVKYELGEGVAKNLSKAFSLYQQSANKGWANGQNNLGIAYRDGNGVAKNEAEAVKWFRKAAEQGYADAQNNLGNMYRDGRGITKSETEAVKWYRKAANQGNISAQASMGRAYHYGLGTDKDFQQAESFYSQAAKGGYEWACERFADLGNDIEKNTQDYCKAKELYQKAIDFCSDGYAYYRLGNLHYFAHRCGGGGYAEAKRLWQIGYEKKSSHCAVNLGYMYYGGFGVEENYKQAEQYFLKGIEFGNNNGFGEYWLGKIYETGGNGVEADTNKSQEYFAAAKKKGYTGP